MEAEIKDTVSAVRRSRRANRAYAILGVIAVVVGGAWYIHHRYTKGNEATDDAQIESDVVPVSGRVGGEIAAVHVRDNQLVKAGDPLFDLGRADLDIEVARTEAELEAARAIAGQAAAQVAIVQQSSSGGLSSARAALTGASASVRGAADSMRAAEAAIARAKADLSTADADYNRTKQLFDRQALTQRDLEHAQQTRDVARAGLDAANAQLDLSRAQRGMAESRVAEAQGHVTQSAPVDQQIAAAQAAASLAAARIKVAEVARDKAKLQRSYATITAPISGMISKLGAHIGQSIMAGQTLLMLVPTENYVIANFKEGQIARMRAGNLAEVELDAFPGSTFHGVIDTIAPATGARFSMIPPDNATGNFVKVVQRVPVKITWTKPPEIALRPGLSAEVTVHVE